MEPGAKTPEFAELRKIILKETSISISEDDDYLLESRLRGVLDDLKLTHFREFLDGLQRPWENNWLERLIDAMTTNETHFFRDINPFQAFQTRIVPVLLENNRDQRSMNLFFAGCSSGQEPYSVAMLLKEQFPQLALWNIDMHGVDISSAMIRKAQEGRYSQFEINRGLPSTLLLKYFKKKGLGWQIDRSILQAVRFTRSHLRDALNASPQLDVLFLRNVLIYFPEKERAEIWPVIEKTLKPGGFLILGAAETPIFQSCAFTLLSSVQAPIYQLRMKT